MQDHFEELHGTLPLRTLVQGTGVGIGRYHVRKLAHLYKELHGTLPQRALEVRGVIDLIDCWRWRCMATRCRVFGVPEQLEVSAIIIRHDVRVKAHEVSNEVLHLLLC